MHFFTLRVHFETLYSTQETILKTSHEKRSRRLSEDLFSCVTDQTEAFLSLLRTMRTITRAIAERTAATRNALLKSPPRQRQAAGCGPKSPEKAKGSVHDTVVFSDVLCAEKLRGNGSDGASTAAIAAGNNCKAGNSHSL